MLSRNTSLSKNIVQFCRFLRQYGYGVSVPEAATALRAMEFIDYNSKATFRLALKAVFCRNRAQLEEFDTLFNQYWKETNQAVDAKLKTRHESMVKPVKTDPAFKSLKAWLNGNKTDQLEEVASYSLYKSMSQKNFADVPDDEVAELMQTIKALSRRLAAHINRRYKKNNRINLPDLRRTLRKNLRRGGELLEIAFRKPKRNRTKLVIICDTSRSMELYAAFLLQFMYAFQHVYSRVETYAFSTSLQQITRLLKQNDFYAAMRVLSAQNEGWSGGTRIGKSLTEFVKNHALKTLDKKTIVIIMSDGWDTGDIDLLQHSMEVIHKRCKKIIWLNPLAGHPGYQPHVAGMKAAMPYINVFASVHNAESLRNLSKWL
jgi:uncharacterized protein with von Willebrand factor type A (vWA) domain